MLIDVLVLFCWIWFIISMISCHKIDRKRWNELDKRYHVINKVVDTITDRNKELEQQNRNLVEFLEHIIDDTICSSTVKSRAKILHEKITKS